MQTRAYTTDPTDELLDNRGITEGIAACHIKFRPKGTVSDGQMWGTKALWYLGKMKGDAAKIADSLTTFKSMTGMSKKKTGNQKTGRDAKLALELTAITPDAKALSYGSKYAPITSFTTYPGTRKYVSSVAGPFVTSNTYALTFTTTEIATETVSSSTVVSVVFATDDTTTKASIKSAIEANTGILSAVWASNVLTVLTKAGYIMTITAAATNTGGTAAAVTNVSTDTSTVTISVDASNGAIDRLSFGVAAGDAALIQAVIDAAPEGGVPQLYLLTGNTAMGTHPEWPYVDRVDVTNDIVYLRTPLAQLPEDLVDVKVVADIEYLPGGESLPEDLEIQLDYRDHSDKSVDIVYIGCASLSDGTEPAYRTADGEVAKLSFELLEQIYTINGKKVMLPYRVKTVNSVTGIY